MIIKNKPQGNHGSGSHILLKTEIKVFIKDFINQKIVLFDLIFA